MNLHFLSHNLQMLFKSLLVVHIRQHGLDRPPCLEGVERSQRGIHHGVPHVFARPPVSVFTDGEFTYIFTENRNIFSIFKKNKGDTGNYPLAN